MLLAIGLLICFIVNISLGSVAIPFQDTLTVLLGKPIENESWRYILLNYRLQKAITAILVGSALALSGLMMQTLFRNPLAGPYVLGISSGASLGAALLIMGTSWFTGFLALGAVNDIALAVMSSLGSFLVLMLVMLVASKIKDTMALLIIGLMFGSFTAALVSIMAYFTHAEKLQRYIIWSMGSIGNLTWPQVALLGILAILATFMAFVAIKPMNALLLGDKYAQSLGIDLKKSRFLIILSTGILAGSVTAFAGPIAFVGMAVPHLTRQLFDTSDHKIIIPAVLLAGAILMLACDTVAQLPGSDSVLPINAITSFLGAPVVIWLLVKRKKIVF